MNASSKFACLVAVCATVSMSVLAANRSDWPPIGSMRWPASQSEVSRQENDQDDPDDGIQIPAHDPDAVARRDFMRTKLLYTQNIFAGLTVGDFDAVDNAIKEVRMITEGGQWVAIDNDTYRRLTDEFKTSAQRLQKAADSRNIEATALRFYEMSTRCIDCHQHLRKANYEL